MFMSTKLYFNYDTEIYNLASGLGLGPRMVLRPFNPSLIRKTYGPKAAWLILASGKEPVVERLEEASQLGLQ